jgi:deoxyguanosine kinase
MSDSLQNIRYIAIEGNIGAGKSTLTKLLSEDINARGLYEHFADNPYLPEFYKNPDKNAFPLEVAFLAERYRQLQEMFEAPDMFQPVVVSDFVFHKSLIFVHVVTRFNFGVVFPQFYGMIYLHREIPSLKANITKRGRSYEQDMKPDYLEKVTSSYFQYFKEVHGMPIVMVKADNHDFLNDSNERKQLLRYLNPLNLKSGLNFFGELS